MREMLPSTQEQETKSKKVLESKLRAIDPELKELYELYKHHYFRYKHALDKKKLSTIDLL